MNPFVWARDSIRRRGLIRTSQIASSTAGDFLFDLRYGTDTRRWVEAEELDTDSENKAHAAHYQATKARPFLKLLRRLELPPGSVFVDFGSGKGRVLLLAAHHGFRRVVGVEFSPRLCALARRNVTAFSTVGVLLSPIDVVEADVTAFEISSDLNIFYFYNPFNAPVLSKVLDNMRRSVKAAPRKLWLIYNTPKHHELIHQSGLFGSCSRHEIGGTEFKVYTR
jgi:SAM-dependent methyltransferase